MVEILWCEDWKRCGTRSSKFAGPRSRPIRLEITINEFTTPVQSDRRERAVNFAPSSTDVGHYFPRHHLSPSAADSFHAVVYQALQNQITLSLWKSIQGKLWTLKNWKLVQVEPIFGESTGSMARFKRFWNDSSTRARSWSRNGPKSKLCIRWLFCFSVLAALHS